VTQKSWPACHSAEGAAQSAVFVPQNGQHPRQHAIGEYARCRGRLIPAPFHYFCFLVLRPGEAGAQHQKKKFGGGEATPEPSPCESILADLV